MKLSDTEWTVMHAVWEQHPASVRDVHERVEEQTGWAYTTVKTILTRLADKGAVQSRKRANALLYEPLITRNQARRAALQSLMENAFDGAFGPLLQHLMTQEKLPKRDRERLAKMLAEEDKKKGRKS